MRDLVSQNAFQGMESDDAIDDMETIEVDELAGNGLLMALRRVCICLIICFLMTIGALAVWMDSERRFSGFLLAVVAFSCTLALLRRSHYAHGSSHRHERHQGRDLYLDDMDVAFGGGGFLDSPKHSDFVSRRLLRELCLEVDDMNDGTGGTCPMGAPPPYDIACDPPPPYTDAVGDSQNIYGVEVHHSGRTSSSSGRSPTNMRLPSYEATQASAEGGLTFGVEVHHHDTSGSNTDSLGSSRSARTAPIDSSNHSLQIQSGSVTPDLAAAAPCPHTEDASWNPSESVTVSLASSDSVPEEVTPPRRCSVGDMVLIPAVHCVGTRSSSLGDTTSCVTDAGASR